MAHAVAHREWVVSVFEGSVPCFLAGGTAKYEPGDGVFAPHCKKPPDSRGVAFVPLGIGSVLLAGLALAGWRHRRFLDRLARRSDPTEP